MTILGIDTALGVCSVALWRGGEVAAEETVPMIAGHAEALAPMVERVLARAGVKAADLARLAVTIGPGTFTGVRIGLSFARAMALALKTPVAGVTTLEALVEGARRAATASTIVAAVIDARRGELYFQLFDDAGAPMDPPALLSHAAALERLDAVSAKAPVVLAGTGAAILKTARPDARVTVSSVLQPEARDVAAIAARRTEVPAAPPEPLYLRAPDAKLPGPPKRRPPKRAP